MINVEKRTKVKVVDRYNQQLFIKLSSIDHVKINFNSLFISSSIGRVGGIIALAMEGLRAYWDPLPFVAMGCLGLISGALSFLLPETTGEQLPETLQESKHIGENYKLTPICPTNLNIRKSSSST